MRTKTLTIRPNGVGSDTEIKYATGANHWAQVASVNDTEYVSSNPLTFKPGDANEDGEVSAGDVTYIERVILDINPETNESDVNQDGAVAMDDVTAVGHIILGNYNFSTSAKKDSYALENPVIPVAPIISVTLKVRIKSGPSAGGKVTPGLLLGGTYLYGAAVTSTLDWVTHSITMTRPGGGNWAYNDFDALQAVILLERGYNANIAVSQVYVEVKYMPTFQLIEAAMDAVSIYLQANIAAKIAELNTDYGDSLLTAPVEWYLGNIPQEIPQCPAVAIQGTGWNPKTQSHYYIEADHKINLFIYVEGQDHEERWRKLCRYALALVELLHEGEAIIGYTCMLNGEMSISDTLDSPSFLQAAMVPITLNKAESY